jgi:TolB-like protein/DNA-binding winged helix-turn-helix (wHTH) protein/Tfp pilus assembly protein PilF
MDALTGDNLLLFEHFRLDRQARALCRLDAAGEFVPVAVGSRAFDVLDVLVGRTGDLISRDEFMAAVGPATAVEDGNLNTQIAALRRVLDEGRADGSCIQTIPGRGYRFTVPVTRLESSDRLAAGGSSGNGAGSPIAERPESRNPSAPSQSGNTSPLARPRELKWLWWGSLVLVGGALCLLAAAVTASNWHLPGPRETRLAPRLSIVVLPFANLSNDPDQQYFADAITDDLTTDLSRIADSFAIARTTAFTYEGKSVDVKQIGRELGVRYVMEGSVRRAGDKVQVNAQLIDPENGAHLWADRFDTDRASLAQAQSVITGRLALALRRELLRDADRRIEQEGAADPDARDLVMRGFALQQSRPNSAANRQQSQQYFEQALERDPQSVLAKLAVAANLVWTVGDGWSNSAEQDKLRAERLLAEVFEREPNSSLLHQVLGALRRTQNRLTEARIEYEMAIALNPNNVTALRNLGLTLMLLAQPEAAIPYIEKALLLDPQGFNSNISYLNFGRCHLLLGHLNEAIELLSKSRAANPRYWVTHLWLAGAFGLRGDLDEARAALAEAIKLKPDINSMARWGARGTGNPQYSALRTRTVDIGLRRAGMPEE